MCWVRQCQALLQALSPPWQPILLTSSKPGSRLRRTWLNVGESTRSCLHFIRSAGVRFIYSRRCRKIYFDGKKIRAVSSCRRQKSKRKNVFGDGVGRSTVHATKHTRPWQHYTTIQREKNLALISIFTLLTCWAMRCATQEFINLVVLSCMLSALIMIWDALTVALHSRLMISHSFFFLIHWLFATWWTMTA